MKITIDKSAGFCPGVMRAISKAEDKLRQEGSFYSLGALLHNDLEMTRLKEEGLRLISHGDLDQLSGRQVLIRAHGEPPETYYKAAQNNVEIVDATCSVVKRLQQKVSAASEEMKKAGGQVVIFGKPGHPELVGLLGHAPGNSVNVSGSDISSVDLSKPVRLFSQTTMDAVQYDEVAEMIRKGMEAAGGAVDFVQYNTICGYVSRREHKIREFALLMDVVIFVSGRQSANGKKLFAVCRETNQRTYFLAEDGELEKDWFMNAGNVGITGSASTPMWLMEEIADRIRAMV